MCWTSAYSNWHSESGAARDNAHSCMLSLPTNTCYCATSDRPVHKGWALHCGSGQRCHFAQDWPGVNLTVAPGSRLRMCWLQLSLCHLPLSRNRVWHCGYGKTSIVPIFQPGKTALKECDNFKNLLQEEPGFLTYENRMSSSYEVGVGLFGVITRDSKYE